MIPNDKIKTIKTNNISSSKEDKSKIKDNISIKKNSKTYNEVVWLTGC